MASFTTLLLVLLIPSFVMLGVMALSLIKYITNGWIHLLLCVAYFGIPISIIFLLEDATGKHEYAGGTLIAIIMLVLNAYPFIRLLRLLNTRRCPNCCQYNGKIVNKTVDEYERVKRELYEHQETGRRYRKTFRTVNRYTNYEMICPVCLMEWDYDEHDNDSSHSGLKKI